MEHVEQAGVHSGDSACTLPPFSLSPQLQDELRRQTVAMAHGLDVVGLMNVQFAIQFPQGSDGEGVVYVLEVNPRASRTVPYLSKITGIPMVKAATNVMLGKTLQEQGYASGLHPNQGSIAVKAGVEGGARCRPCGLGDITGCS